MPASHQYISVRTIADELDVPERTVRRWVADGELNIVRFGTRCVRVPVGDYQTFKLRHFAAV